MDVNKKSRNKVEDNNKLLKNDMDVFSSSEDETVSSLSSRTRNSCSSFERDIILHGTPRLANCMSVDSDSESDFVQSPQCTSRLSVLSSNNKIKIIKMEGNIPQKKRRNKKNNLSQISKSTSKTSLTVAKNETPKKSTPIHIISNERVKIPRSSLSKENKVQNNNVQKKSSVARNIFGPFPSTSNQTQILIDRSTQTDCESHESSENASGSSSTNNGPNDVEVQTDQKIAEQATKDNNIPTPEVNLNRPHNMATQTDLKTIIISDEENRQKEEAIKRKPIQIQVTPPKRLKTINEECPVLRLIDEHINKLETTRVNLTELFQSTTSVQSKILQKHESISAKKSNLTAKNSAKKTPMKQLTITDLNFCKNKNKPSATTTPSTSPIKSTSSISPAKSDKSKKSPEKKETRYTQESHNRVFEHVKQIVNWVFKNENYSILFTKSETDLINKLFDLPDRRLTVLCIRLFTRQHNWYNLSKFCEELNLTDEGFNLQEFYSTLTAGFVSSDYSAEKIEDLLDYLTLPDIKNICNSFKIRAYSKRKNEMINKLLAYSRNQCTLTSLKRADQVLRERVKDQLGICVKLETKLRDILYRVHLLYSITNPDLETPNDIYNLMYKIRNEIVKYPKVKIDSSLIFSDRQDFLKFAEACILRKEFYDQIAKKDISSEHLLCVEAFKRLEYLLSIAEQIKFDKKKPMFLRRFSAAWVYCKVLTSASQNLGKQHSDDVCKWLTEMLQQKVYCIHSRGYWHSQLALVTRAHKKNIIGEAQTIVDGLSDKHVNEVQKHELSIRGSKILKVKLSQMLYDQLQCLLLPEIDIPISRTIQANVVHNNERGKKLQFVRTTSEGKEYGSVEETAINYYKTEDIYTHGIHCEGQLFDALFLILFWDILYSMHIPNTFITEIQNRPLDLFSGEFYTNRTNKINARLKNIRDDWTLDIICDFASKIYSTHSLEFKSLCSFDFVEEGTFHIIIKSIGKKVLAAALERLAKDYKQFHSGLPDLFLWNYKELKCCFVEVKSENDKLSTKQILWINFLHKYGAKVEVCYVEHIGSTSTKKIKKRNEDK